MQKLLLQRSVHQRVLRNTPRKHIQEKSSSVRHPGASIIANGNVEWSSAVVGVNTHGLMWVAMFEYIHGVVSEAGDPDVTIRVGAEPLRPQRAALISVRLGHCRP